MLFTIFVVWATACWVGDGAGGAATVMLTVPVSFATSETVVPDKVPLKVCVPSAATHCVEYICDAPEARETAMVLSALESRLNVRVLSSLLAVLLYTTAYTVID